MGYVKLYLSVCVVIFHTSTWLGNIGYSCVFGFFIMSGYGISYSILNNSSFNLVKFYVKRIKKIYVPYVICLLFTLLIYSFYGDYLPKAFPCYDANFDIKKIVMEFLYNYGAMDNGWYLFNGFPKLLPQCWTDPVMIFYYILSPAIVFMKKMKKLYIGIGMILFIIPLVTYIYEFDFSTYRYRSVYCVLIYFFLGGAFVNNLKGMVYPKLKMCFFMTIYLLYFSTNIIDALELQIMLSLFILVPMIICGINLQRNNTELMCAEIASYIYLTHFIGIAIYEIVCYKVSILGAQEWKTIIIMCFTVVLSILLRICVHFKLKNIYQFK